MDAALSLLIELRVLDRLRDLRGDREQELDLFLGEVARHPGADVEGALEPLAAGEDRHRQDRLVLVLRQVGEVLEARIEVRLGGDHHRRPLLGRGARDPLARPHPRALSHLLDAGPVGGAQHELRRPLVVQIDETGVRA